MARVLLVRHCQTTGGSPDSPLTEKGREQAETLAAWLAGRGVDRIVSSPYQRAVDTILPFAGQAGLEVETDERLQERNLGGWFATQQERLNAVRAVLADYSLRLEGGETGHELVARSRPALVEALGGPNGLTVLVAHRQLNSHLLGTIDPMFGYEGMLAMTTPDVFEVWRDDDGLHFKRLWEAG